MLQLEPLLAWPELILNGCPLANLGGQCWRPRALAAAQLEAMMARMLSLRNGAMAADADVPAQEALERLRQLLKLRKRGTEFTVRPLNRDRQTRYASEFYGHIR